jgi:hypothetical protein
MLSKSRFTTGLQCHRLLWWLVNEREAPELVASPDQQAIFDQGSFVGEVARSYIPGGLLIDLPYWEKAERVRATRESMDAGKHVIYEASFEADGVFVSVDILHRALRVRGWTLSEVKSTTRVKPPHIPDAAVQTHVLRRSGVPVAHTELMHLNRGCRHPDLSNLFARTVIDDEVESYLPAVPREVKRQLRMLEQPKPPTVEPGPHCTAPYECPFLSRCHGDGAATVPGRKYVDRAGLAETLAQLEGPIAHLDFETINPAIPVWQGCRPYDAVPVQFSVHAEPTGGATTTTHHEWLAKGPGDPRPELTRALVSALRGARSIIVYHQAFEKARLRELQAAVPDQAEALQSIIDRLVDLLPIVRDHVEHPGFEGSYGLKHVAPTLVPGLRYDDMAIGNGGAASRALSAMLLGADRSPEETRSTRAALLAYCAQDTRATMGVLAWLRNEAKGARS